MIELRVLGSPHLRVVDDPATLHLQPKRLAILAYLAVEATGRPCRRDTLVALFWPGADERRARNALSQALHGLRRSLGAGVVGRAGAEEILVDPDALWCDAWAFERAIDEGRFRDAVELYRGGLVEGLHVRGAREFEGWATRTRERLRRRAAESLEILIERSEHEGNIPASVEGLRRLAEISPGDEAVIRRLMRVLDRAGDRAGALRVYDRFARHLTMEIGLDPSPESAQLAERLRKGPEDAVRGVPAVAVLPFNDLGPDGQLEYFGHGLTEEVIATLARGTGIRVVARTTVFATDAAHRDVRSLGAWLGVDAVVEGSVRRSGPDLRVSARLVDAESGHTLWSETYDRAWGDVLGLQDEIGDAVATTLRDRLVPAPGPRRHDDDDRGRERQAGSRPGDAAAHDLYLRGLYHRRKRTRPALADACSCFERCVEQAPDHAAGHAALAFTYALAGWWVFDVFSPRDAYPIARAAATRALELDPRLPEAHLALAITRQAFDWDGQGAEVAFGRALALDPENPDALGNYAGHLVLRGRYDDAIVITRKAEKLDPGWIMPPTARGLWLLAARRFAAAETELERAIALEPGFFMPVMFLGDCHRFAGRPDEAARLYQRAMSLSGPEPILLGRMACAAAEQGDGARARSIVEELESPADGRSLLPSIPARAWMSLGDLDAGYDRLEQAVEARDTTLAILPIWPGFDPARRDPRYDGLLARVRLWR